MLADKVSAMTVLLVEDDVELLRLYVEALSMLTQYDIHAVTTSTDALQFVKQVSPSLFVLDYLLPDMNGLELYDHLHATPGLENVPAIIVSASFSGPLRFEIERRKLMRLQKPFTLRVFVATIKQVLDQSHQLTF